MSHEEDRIGLVVSRRPEQLASLERSAPNQRTVLSELDLLIRIDEGRGQFSEQEGSFLNTVTQLEHFIRADYIVSAVLRDAGPTEAQRRIEVLGELTERGKARLALLFAESVLRVE